MNEDPQVTGTDRVLRPVSYFLKKKLGQFSLFCFRGFNLALNEAPDRGGRVVLNMCREDQTVDHTNMLMGNDHDTIFIDFSEYTGQDDQ